MVKHMTVLCLLVVTFGICVIRDVNGYGDAVFTYVADYACVDMFPNGHGVPAQQSASPYVAEVPAKYTPGQGLTVTLKSTDGSMFKGFVLQAHRVDNGEKVGEFTPIAGTKQNCGNSGGKTLSHSSDSPKNDLAITWTPPDSGVGNIKFVYTVVRHKSEFWVKVESTDLSENTGETHSGQTTTTTTSTTTTTLSTPTQTVREQTDVLSPVDTAACGSSKGCYRQPKDCSGNCDVIVTWQKDGVDKVTFEIQGSVTTAETYVALGLSRDNKMEDDSVTECVFSSSSVANTGVFMSYNGRYSNSRLSDPTLGLDSASSKVYYKDGQLICQFKRYITVPQSTTTTVSSGGPVAAALTGNSQVFPLNDNYTLFVAIGAWSGSSISHHDSKIQSPTKVDLSSDQFSNIGGTTGFPMVKAHGVLMIVAWMISASIAVMMPRHHKTSWPDKKCCGKQIWFMIHQPLMLITSAITIAAFIIIFVSVGGYADYKTYPENVHPPLGIVTTALVVINPLMAACRPHPGTSKRPVFNVLHFIVGQGAHCCSAATIFIALYMSKVATPDWCIWVMVAYICWHTLIEIILSIRKCCIKKKAEPAADKYEMNISNGPEITRQTQPEHQSSKFMTFMVIIHALGVIALAIALIVPIVTA